MLIYRVFSTSGIYEDDPVVEQEYFNNSLDAADFELQLTKKYGDDYFVGIDEIELHESKIVVKETIYEFHGYFILSEPIVVTEMYLDDISRDVTDLDIYVLVHNSSGITAHIKVISNSLEQAMAKATKELHWELKRLGVKFKK